ncbi:DUF4345 domain-containing protein [Proteobacteria bacterium 005FR1]|nr:DUF4345 domain-containing protein [Proteobacteria bacterium 005FR1]
MRKTSAVTSRVFLLIVAASFLILGLIALIDPPGTVAPLGIALESASALTEIRATYGGMMIGVAVFLSYTATYRVREGLIATIAMLGSIGIVRLYGIVFDQSQVLIQFSLLGVELGLTALAIVLLYIENRANASS